MTDPHTPGTESAPSLPVEVEAPSAAEDYEIILEALRIEEGAIGRLASSLSMSETQAAIELLNGCAGLVAVTGLGKSGLIAQKISATLSSLGIPSHFLHPSEALHGDLGRLRGSDVVWALSYSGNTDEVVQLAAVLKADGLPILGMSSSAQSRLGQIATVHISLGSITEACPMNLAPTASTTAMLALGDAIALAVSHRRRFSHEEYHKRHPGGTLGVLLQPVTQILRFRVGANLALIPVQSTVAQALARAETGRRPGAMIIVDDTDRMVGFFTDGDFRRLMIRDPSALNRPVSEVMTRCPRYLTVDSIVRDAVQMEQSFRMDEIPVLDHERRPVGLIDVQDLIALRIIHVDE